MNANIVPTVGRIVLCHNVSKHGPIPGIIVHVWGNERGSLANVLALGDGSNEPITTPLLSVHICDPDEPPRKDWPYCTWIPFQKGQAARTEQLEGELLEARAMIDPALQSAATELLAELRSLVQGLRAFAPELKAKILES